MWMFVDIWPSVPQRRLWREGQNDDRGQTGVKLLKAFYKAKGYDASI
jgi:hypothetical protein